MGGAAGPGRAAPLRDREGARRAARRAERRAAWRAFGGCLAFRAANALLVRTAFVPDEYWQSLEVAHDLVFGYGHRTWEWAPETALRSFAHPVLFAAPYAALRLLGLDGTALFVLAPRLLQAALAAATDALVYLLARRRFGPAAAEWALACELGNWFTFFCAPRTLVNNLEALAALAALLTWPAPGVALALAGCLLRPSGALLWVPLGLRELRRQRRPGAFLLREVALPGAALAAADFAFESWMYGRWVFPPLRFLEFNVLRGGSAFYGVHPWHWYLTQGFPAMAASLLPLMAVGALRAEDRTLAGVAAWGLAYHSCVPHKEFRFVLPSLHLLLPYAGVACERLFGPLGPLVRRAGVAPGPEGRPAGPRCGWRGPAGRRALLLALVFLPQAGLAAYFAGWHQAGTIAVMHHLRREVQAGRVAESGGGVLFLTPCHATPLYSYVHAPVPLRFLDCSPPPPGRNPAAHRTEEAAFFAGPGAWLERAFPRRLFGALPPRTLPSHLVMFDPLEAEVRPFLRRHGYRRTWQAFHSHFAVDRGLQARVLVYTRGGGGGGGGGG